MQGALGEEAFGKPGIQPRWTHSDKAGVGTAYSASSHLWFTVWDGIVTEVYYPTVDRNFAISSISSLMERPSSTRRSEI
jgi:hypothetical protein